MGSDENSGFLNNLIPDERVPRGEVWLYSTRLPYIINPDGRTELSIPDLRITNVKVPEVKDVD